MGICGTSDQPKKTVQSKTIENSLKKHAKTLASQVRLLLLGPGESGKSTVFKQMKILQDEGGFTNEEKLSFRDQIYNNCVSQMRTMIEAAITIRHPLSKKESITYAQKIIKITSNVTWTKELGEMIKHLWSDPGIQEIYKKQGLMYQLNDTTQYFMEQIDRINRADFIPNEEDVLRVRIRSTGIEEAEFYFDNYLFRVIDVGGQRSERRKWIHCFDGITAVLFCTSLIDYYLPLKEDPRMNRLRESLILFKEVCEQEAFHNKTIIFFLNKTDLLEEKLPHYPLEDWYPEFKRPQSKDPQDNYKAASEFLKELFLNQVDTKKRSLNSLFVHFTCALDTKNIELVITAVRMKIMEDLLGNAGFE